MTQVLTSEIHQEAIEAAVAASKALQDKYGDVGACGFAWVHTNSTVKGNTKLGRSFIQFGFKKSWTKGHFLWNPSSNYSQSVDIKEAGAQAYVDVLNKYGLGEFVYTGSRLD